MPQQPQSREDRVKADAREQSTVRLILDILGRPGAATAGAVRGLVRSDQDVWDNIMGNLSGRKRDSFDDVLGDMGMGPSWTRSGLGLAADIVVDPTNLIPFGAATKVVKGAGKGLGRLAGAALDVLPKGDVVKDAALTAKNALGKAFVPYYGLPEDFARLRRERDVVARNIPNRTYDELLDSFRGTTTAERQAVATALDTGVLPGKVNLDDLAKQYRNTLTKTFLKESDAGLQQSTNFIGDYFPYVFRDKYGNAISQGGGVNARLPFAKKRTSESLADAAAKGADTDAATALFTRLTKGRTAVHDAEFVQNVLAKYGVDASQGVPSGFMKPRQGRIADRPFWSNEISLDGASTLTPLGNVALPKDIADNISSLLDSGNTEDVVRGWDWLTRKWKGLATIYRPDIAFEMTNFQGNLWNSRLGGQDWALPKHVGRFWQPTPTGNIGGLTPDEVVEAAKKYGISAVSGSSIGDAINADSLASGLARSLEPWSERTARMLVPTSDPSTWHRPVTGLPRLAGSGFKTFKDWLNPKVELASKQSFFEDALRKHEGLPKDEQIWRAYDDVSKYMFDYGELTDFERNVMRRVIPFYSWLRKNTPVAAKGITDRPSSYASLDKIINASEGLTEDLGIQEPPEYRPEWMQRNPVMQVPNLLPGAPEGSTQFLNLYLPLQDLNKIPMPGGSDVLDVGKELLSGVHPALKLPYELLSGKSAFTGLPVYDEQLGPVDDLRRAPFPFNWIPTDVTDALPFVKAATVRTPDGPEVQTSAGFNTAFNTMLPLASTGGRVLDTMVGTGLPSQAFSPWTSLLGMRFMPRTPEQMNQSRRSAFTTYKSKTTKERKQRDQGGNSLEDYINRVLNGGR